MTVVDGLFFHPKGSKPTDVLSRLVEGTTNGRLDNPFAPAINDTASEIAKLNEQIERAEIRTKLLRAAKERAEEKLLAQAEAVEKYSETGEIDPILEPSVDRLAAAEVAKQDAEYKKEIEFAVPDQLVEAGWSQKGRIRVTEYEEIVVLRRSRKEYSERVEKVEERLSKAIQFSMLPFRTDGEHFHLLRERIAKRPQQPEGPPHD